MRCFELHCQRDGCAQEIPDHGSGKPWTYCPNCGRATGHIVLSLDDALLHVPMNKPETQSISISNSGRSPIAVSVSLISDIDGVTIATSKPPVLTVRPRIAEQVYIDVPPLSSDVSRLATVIVRSGDGALPDGEDPWNCEKAREREATLDLEAVVDRPAELEPSESVALFRQDVGERIVTIRNKGNEPAVISQFIAPTGYRAEVVGGVNTVRGGGEIRCKVTRDWTKPAWPKDWLKVRVNNGSCPDVELHCSTTADVRPLLQAIIGIDFGTTYSSVAFRECRYHKEQDSVLFLAPPNEEERFPSVVWISHQGEIACGDRAKARLDAEPNAGYLFAEIKTLLRDHDPQEYPRIEPTSREFDYRAEAYALAERWLGSNWKHEIVTRYLEWIYQLCMVPKLNDKYGTTDADVHYIFSLPVLDHGIGDDEQSQVVGDIQFNMQQANMAACLRAAGFPYDENPANSKVSFEFEPACAVLGLLHKPDTASGIDNANWPLLGAFPYQVKNGDKVAVFDSGGGTTDVVLAKVKEEEDGRYALQVTRCLGVGHDLETFGGEYVTRRLLTELNRANGVLPADSVAPKEETVDDFPSDWFTPVRQFDGLRIHMAVGDSPIMFDTAQRVKFKLATSQPFETKYVGAVGQEEPTTIKPTLLYYLTRARLKSLSEQLEARVLKADERKEVRYYLLVGGNTRLKFLQRWIELQMQDQNPAASRRILLLPDGYRQLAVAYGAAWVPDARVHNAAPYEVTVQLDTQVVLRLPKFQAQDVHPKPKNFEMGAGTKLTVEVRAQVPEGEYKVATAEIVNPYPGTTKVQTETSLHNGEITVSYCLGEIGAAEPVRTALTYRL
jgi:hypothetical protein